MEGVWWEVEGRGGSFPARLEEQQGAVPLSWRGVAFGVEGWAGLVWGWMEVEKELYRA